MLRLFLACFGWYLTILGASAGRNTSVDGSLLDKFQQNDYNLKFERCSVGRYDKRYIKSFDALTYKYNRTAAVVNASLEFKQTTGFELEVIVQAYRFASNEYRSFPIHFQYNFCEAVAKNVMGIADFRNCGTFTKCPLIKDKTYRVCNWSPNPAKFPPLVPSGEYMLEFQAVYSSAELFVLRCYGSVLRPIVNFRII